MILAVMLAMFGLADIVLVDAAGHAQGANPFGGNPFGGSAAAAPPDGIVGWLLAKQAEFYRGLSTLIRQARTDGTAVWGLLGLSFLYGIFHAAGPGHGKAVISSYVIANDETWRRGVALSFASAFLQALVAVAVVGIAAVLLGVTAARMNDAVRIIEIVSYGLIALIGLRLMWVKGRGLVSALRDRNHENHAHAHHDHEHHGHGHDGHHHHDHAHVHSHHDHGHDSHGHRHDDHCGHSHGPEPKDLAGPGGWRRGLAAIFAVGLRPCSGAILVLVFAFAQGLFWAGVASAFIMGFGTALTVAAIAVFAVGAKGLAMRLLGHSGGSGVLVLRGVELLAAVLVFLFGLALLMGYMANERLMGF